MNIAVLGTGNIGGTLGLKWAQAGHRVTFGSRDPSSPKAQDMISQSNGLASVQSFGDAILAGDAILFAVPYAAVAAVAQEHAAALQGKLIIDATNNFGAPVVNNLAVLQRYAPSASHFRAFNATGWENFANPLYGETPVDVFYCGPDNQARPIMEKLIADIGLRPIYLGGLELAPVVDALGSLWVTLAFRQGWGRGIALKLMQR